MKKLLGVLLLLGTTSLVFADCCDCKYTSHTFFSVRPLYQSASPERVSSFHDPMKKEDGRNGHMEFTFFGGKSTNSSSLNTFFFPFCKQTLTVNEDFTAPDTDLIAQNFDIATVNGINPLRTPAQTPFSSTITIAPRQSVFGLGFTWRQDFNWLANKCGLDKNMWFEISTPLTHVKNKVNLTENVISDGGGAATITGLPDDQVEVGNMTEAFKQPRWNYGKIDDCHKLTKTRLADIELKLGTEWIDGDCCGVEGYVGLVIPTGNKPKAEYLFEAIVGNNRHFGIMTGGSAYFKLWENDCWTINLNIDCDWRYLFSRTETRSFDLKYKPWSRYVEVYANVAQAQQAATLALTNLTAAVYENTPGINIFTQDMKVTPRLMSSNTTAFVMTNERYEFEAGYNLYFREAECVKLKNAWQDVAAIKSNVGQGRTNSTRTINNDFTLLNDAIFSTANYNAAVITANDIDLESASHPAMLSNTIYGAASYKFEKRCYPMFAGLGASYEFGNGSEVMKRYTLWGKLGISF